MGRCKGEGVTICQGKTKSTEGIFAALHHEPL